MGFFGNLKDALRIDDEEEDDDIAYEREMKSRAKKEKKKKTERIRKSYQEEEYYSEPSPAESVYPESEADYGSFDSSGRFNPPRSPEMYHNTAPRRSRRNVYTQSDGSEISILRVRDLNDAKEVCDYLVNGRPIVVNFDRPNGSEAQRIMDFLSGCIYSINGNLHPISDSVFMFSPRDVDVSGDYVNMMQKNGFGVPTFNKMI